MTTAEAPAAPETFALLPATVAAVPFTREAPAPKAADRVETVMSGSMSVPKTSQNPEVDRLIAEYSANYEVPESLVRRIVKRESTFNPRARNGPYWGLMQILPATARSMGFSGPPQALLDAETNLKYAVKYLKGAYLVAGGDHDQAVRNYSRGYYYEAKRKGMLGVLDGALVAKKRTRMPEGGIAVASAGAATPLPAASSPAQNVASQWETGFHTATGAKSAGLRGSNGGLATNASARAGETGTGFGPAGAVSTPSLGLSGPAD